MSREEVLASTGMSAAHFDRAAEIAMALFRFGVERSKARGLILVDTKYELGIDPAGEIVVIDEIHTPDSSRYWLASTYPERFARGDEPESLDKEYLRRWLADAGFRGDGDVPEVPSSVRVRAAAKYIEAYELITGQAFAPDESEPVARIRQNLARYIR